MTPMDAPTMMHQSPAHDGPGHGSSTVAEHEPAGLYGLIAEFDNVNDAVDAAAAAREQGYQAFDLHTPFAIHGVEKAVGIKTTCLPWIVLAAGLTGMTAGIVLTCYTMATEYFQVPAVPFQPPLTGYQYLISGKPLVSFPAFIPVIFEMTIFCAAHTAWIAMLLLNRLPMLYHPLHKSRRFKRATQDRFFLVIEAVDARFDTQGTQQFLNDRRGVISVEAVEE